MSDNLLFVQCQPFTLAGAGASIGDETIILTSMKDINGVLLTMADFGTVGFATIEPGNGIQEEQISFSGITQNSNGTATLTGVYTVLMKFPYTPTIRVGKTHAGGTQLVISNTAGFYDRLTSKNDDEAIAGTWTFTNSDVTPANQKYPQMTNSGLGYRPINPTQLATKDYVDFVGSTGTPDASTSVAGKVQLATQIQNDAKTTSGSTGAKLFSSPNLIRATNINDYVASDTGAADAYAIATNPVITAYAEGQVFIFKAAHANTTASTLAVCSLTATAIKKNHDVALVAGDIEAGQTVVVSYDGTYMQMISPNGHDPASLYQLLSNLDTTVTLGGSDSKYPSQNAVKTYVDNNPPSSTNGVATRAGNASNGAVNYAHGLGRVPKKVRITALWYPSSVAYAYGVAHSFGVYNGTTISCVYDGPDKTGAGTNTAVIGQSSTYVVYIAYHSGDDSAEHGQEATIAVDSTNITLTWTQVGSGGTADSIQIMWEVQ